MMFGREGGGSDSTGTLKPLREKVGLTQRYSNSRAQCRLDGARITPGNRCIYAIFYR